MLTVEWKPSGKGGMMLLLLEGGNDGTKRNVTSWCKGASGETNKEKNEAGSRASS